MFRTPGNYSGRFGLAVALGGLRPEHQVAVVEMATGHFGEIDAMCAMAPPEVAVVTAVDAAHLVALGDIDGVAREKASLLGHLPADGLAVLNADDPRVAAMAEDCPAPVVTYGVARGPDPRDFAATDIGTTASGTSFTCIHDGIRTPVGVPLLGARGVVPAALAALAVGHHFDVAPAEAVTALGRASHLPGRLRPLPGRSGSLVLDDTYNAAPRSVLAGLASLGELPGRPRIAVLGDMAELGAASEELHRVVGRAAAEVVDILVTQGNAAAWVADEARSAGLPDGRIAVTFTPEDAAAEAAAHLGPDAVVLVKGSSVAADGAGGRATGGRRRRCRRGARPPGPGLEARTVVQLDRPTWLGVDLSAVTHNVRRLAERAAGAELMVVLKADAYGHGAVQVAHTALRSGASWLGVACVPEGRALRRAGIRAPILVLGYTPGWQAREAVGLGLDMAVFDLDTARAFGIAARALDTTASVHVKVDTGMHRLGVAAERAAGFVREVQAVDGVDVVRALHALRLRRRHLAGRGGGHRRPAGRLRPGAGRSRRHRSPAPGRPRVEQRRTAGAPRRHLRPGPAGHRRLRVAARPGRAGARPASGAVVDLAGGPGPRPGRRGLGGLRAHVDGGPAEPGGDGAGRIRRRTAPGPGHLAARAGAGMPGAVGRPGVDGPDLGRRDGHRWRAPR